MKVVQINAVSGTGSTGTIVKNISRVLNSHDEENYIFYASGKDDDANAVRISETRDMKIHALLSHITGKQAYFSKRSTSRLLKRLDEIKPDIVHLHNLHHNYINLNMLLDHLAERDINTVISLHDCWFFTAKCTHYTNTGCYRWQNGCGKCPLLKADNPSWFFDRTKEMWIDKKNRFEKIKSLEVIGVSAWIAGEAEKSFLSCGNISYIHNGIDTNIFTGSGADLRAKLGLENKFVVLGIANKWQSSVNEGLLEYVSKRLDKDCVMLLVGGTAKDMDNVINIPYIKSREELATVYRTADVFVNVTREDSLPTVSIEAMSCGTPVITYDACGSAEMITEETGIVIKEGDMEAILSAVSVVKDNGKSFYSKSCSEHIKKNYEMNTQYEKYYNIYRGVLA